MPLMTTPFPIPRPLLKRDEHIGQILMGAQFSQRRRRGALADPLADRFHNPPATQREE